MTINYPVFRKQQPLADRFWAKVDTHGPIHSVLKTRCWLWTGATTKSGYGNISRGRVDAGNAVAHHIAWELAGRLISPDKLLLHRCDVRRCVREDHLFTGTAAENTADMYAKGRAAVGSRHGGAKLTEQIVRQIRQRTEPPLELAREFTVSPQTIRDVRNGRYWRHVA